MISNQKEHDRSTFLRNKRNFSYLVQSILFVLAIVFFYLSNNFVEKIVCAVLVVFCLLGFFAIHSRWVERLGYFFLALIILGFGIGD